MVAASVLSARIFSACARYAPGLFLADDESWFDTLIEAINEIFALDLGEYEYFNVTVGLVSGLRGVIVALFAGIIIASAMAIFNRRVLGAFVRSLVGENCSDAASAQTLTQLGYMKNTAVRAAIKGGNSYRGLVRCVEQDEYNIALEQRRGEYNAAAAASDKKMPPFKPVPFKFDFTTAHFYIPEPLHYRAGVRFERRGTGWPVFILIVIVSVVALYAILKLLPDLLQFADNFIGGIAES